MQAVALVVEYNPLHNGHLHHIAKAKERFPDAAIIAILNGNFLQRGEPAILDKRIRTKWALEAGVDLVVELPFAFGTQRADIFARGAVQIAQGLNAHAIIYGVENPIPIHPQLKILAANQKLGFFYQKAITDFAFPLLPIPIPRIHTQYNDTYPTHQHIASATTIRTLLAEQQPIDEYVPLYVTKHLREQQKFLAKIENYFPYLRYHLTQPKNTLALTQDGSIHNIYKNLELSPDYATFFTKVHHKHTSKTHIQRMLTYILCQVEQKTLDEATKKPWTRVLGVSSRGQKYLRHLKKHDLLTIPLIQKLNELKKPHYQLQYNSIVAYSCITQLPLHLLLIQENSHQILFHNNGGTL